MHRVQRICLIEDDPIMGESVADRFRLEGFEVDWYRDGESAGTALRSHRYLIVISDVRLPGISGEDIFAALSLEPGLVPPFIFITAFATVDHAVAMLKRGAADYITKPFDIAELVDKVRRLVGISAPVVDQSDDLSLGPSGPMRSLAATAPRIAKRARIVLVTGESGAGKEVVATHLHRLCFPDGKAPFVAVNCGAIPDTLVESEFFGSERGAFTSADRMRKGFFEQASGGTLFLDEIADLPLAMQGKLLRSIQERTVQRLGSETPINVDVRIICATNQDLKTRVESGTFREDLFYRINVVRLHVPPLRERLPDVLWLARQFLAEQGARLNEPHKTLDPTVQAALLAHEWRGNVRELKNRIERACVLSESSLLAVDDLFGEMEGHHASDGLPTLEAFLLEAERAYIQTALARHHGKVGVTAAALGVSRKTLWEKSKRYGIRVDEHSDPMPG